MIKDQYDHLCTLTRKELRLMGWGKKAASNIISRCDK
jgi:hypothetical protein